MPSSFRAAGTLRSAGSFGGRGGSSLERERERDGNSIRSTVPSPLRPNSVESSRGIFLAAAPHYRTRTLSKRLPEAKEHLVMIMIIIILMILIILILLILLLLILLLMMIIMMMII